MTDRPGDGPPAGPRDDRPDLPVGRLSEDEVIPAESATTVLVRDGDRGLEVFMLERHVETEFAGGAYVFPGGRVEPTDRGLSADRWEGLDLDDAADRMDVEPDLALGLHVAAVRETFEEAGVLLATRRGDPVTAADLAAPSFAEARVVLAARDADFDWEGWLAEEGLVLDLGALAWWSWWVTPRGVHRRYETRFFLAAAPEDQLGAHDDVETVASTWTTPEDALSAGREGRATIVYPTRRNLEALATYGSAEEALDAARRGEVDTRRTLPEIAQAPDGGIAIRHPHTGELDDP